jgi:drug/metabolite transporter (DMT)-like permease
MTFSELAHLHPHSNLRGSLFMAVGMASFTINDAITKEMSTEMNFGQVMLVRGAFAMLLMAALFFRRSKVRGISTGMVMPVVLRVAAEVAGTIAFLTAIVHLPLANTAAIFQALPLAVTLGAAVFLREPVGWRRWLAISAGFIGVLVIIRPGLAGFSEFSLYALLSVVFFAVRDLATRRIPAQVPSLFVTFVTTVAVMVMGGPILFPLGGWTPLSPKGVSLLALAAVLILVGYQCVIIALRAGDISAIAPFRYTALLWAILLGYLVFGDIPDAMMATGATIIVLSGLYTFYRERKLDRRLAASASAVPPEGV